MTEREQDQLRAALVTVAHALEMDESEAFRSPLAFAVRASLKVYDLRRRAAPEARP